MRRFRYPSCIWKWTESTRQKTDRDVETEPGKVLEVVQVRIPVEGREEECAYHTANMEARMVKCQGQSDHGKGYTAIPKEGNNFALYLGAWCCQIHY